MTVANAAWLAIGTKFSDATAPDATWIIAESPLPGGRRLAVCIESSRPPGHSKGNTVLAHLFAGPFTIKETA